MQEITLQYTHNTNFRGACLYIFLITLTLFPNPTVGEDELIKDLILSLLFSLFVLLFTFSF